jgi:hypothetical protein
VQQYGNRQYSQQQGTQLLGVEALTQGMDGKEEHDFKKRRAEQTTKEAGEARASVNTALEERSEAMDLLAGIRSAANSALQNPEETSPLMQLPSLQAVAHLREGRLRLLDYANALIEKPNGLLAILNSRVSLYTRDSQGVYRLGDPVKLFQIITNKFGYRPTNYAQLEQVLHTVGVALINWAKKNSTIIYGSFALSEVAVHNLALRILENRYWNRLLGMSVQQISAAERDIKRYGMWLGGDLSFSGKPPEDPKHQGGKRTRRKMKRKRTRRRKMKRKRTRRRKMKRKRTRNHHKRKKRTRKH